jgi:hypothetical protein
VVDVRADRRRRRDIRGLDCAEVRLDVASVLCSLPGVSSNYMSLVLRNLRYPRMCTVKNQQNCHIFLLML